MALFKIHGFLHFIFRDTKMSLGMVNQEKMNLETILKTIEDNGILTNLYGPF